MRLVWNTDSMDICLSTYIVAVAPHKCKEHLGNSDRGYHPSNATELFKFARIHISVFGVSRFESWPLLFKSISIFQSALVALPRCFPEQVRCSTSMQSFRTPRVWSLVLPQVHAYASGEPQSIDLRHLDWEVDHTCIETLSRAQFTQNVMSIAVPMTQ